MDLHKFRSTLGQHPLAYMSAEFALDDRLPIFAGGLGVLAGDIVREANDMNLPFVAVGLLYKEGYLKQVVTSAGEQVEEYPVLQLEHTPIELVVNTEGERIMVAIHVKDRTIHAQIWEYLRGDVSVYLLDTDIPENSPTDRLITHRLYGGDQSNHILQEIVLGIGGVRALRQLHIHPSIFHLNESHSALAIFEITHHYMEEYGMSFREAYEYARQKIVFTNHTLIPEANEAFPATMVKEYLQNYARHLSLPIEEILNDGMAASHPDTFSLSTLALKLACRVNAVSQLHSKMAKTVWPDIAMPAITNGIHLPTWVDADLKAQATNFDTQAIAQLAPKELWSIHTKAKHHLIDEVKFRTGQQLQHDHLTITWARRLAEYKRPTLLFEDIVALQQLVEQTNYPLQILLAGKAHPLDPVGHSIIHTIAQVISQHHLQPNIVFLPNYDLTLAKLLVAGSDLWINTPVRGKEASGTSGMKAGANGVLPLTVSDGWVDEVDLSTCGWIITDERAQADLFQRLLQDIAPLYYQRDEEDVPQEWIKRMKAMIALIWQRFSTRRMLNEYIDILYRPALELEIKDKHDHDWRRNYRSRAT